MWNSCWFDVATVNVVLFLLHNSETIVFCNALQIAMLMRPNSTAISGFHIKINCYEHMWWQTQFALAGKLFGWIGSEREIPGEILSVYRINIGCYSIKMLMNLHIWFIIQQMRNSIPILSINDLWIFFKHRVEIAVDFFWFMFNEMQKVYL